MIDQSESTEDIKDQAQLFLDNEPRLWYVVAKWLELYSSRDLLVDDLGAVSFNPSELAITIKEPQVIVSESERLENLKKRKDLGLNTDVELIMADNPGMSVAEAEAKLLKLSEEKAAKVKFAQESMLPGDGDEDADSEDADKPDDEAAN
jgi:hypothetical protein